MKDFVLNFKNRLDLKDQVNFKIYDVMAWLTTQILLNISRIKGNQTMKFGELIEHPKRNISL